MDIKVYILTSQCSLNIDIKVEKLQRLFDGCAVYIGKGIFTLKSRVET